MYKQIFNFQDRLLVEVAPDGRFWFRCSVDNVEFVLYFTPTEACNLASKILLAINGDPSVFNQVDKSKPNRAPADGLHTHDFKKTFTAAEVNEYLGEEIRKMQNVYKAAAGFKRRYGRR